MMSSELLVAGTIAACFLGIGIAIESAARDSDTVDWSAPSGWLVHGWAVLCSVGVIAALGGTKLREILTVAALFGVGGLLALGTTNKSRRSALLALLLATSLVGPLLWITSQTPATIFDEFGQWLPNARFLYENDSFPTASNPNVWSGKPGYPPGVPLTILAGSELLGEFADRIRQDTCHYHRHSFWLGTRGPSFRTHGSVSCACSWCGQCYCSKSLLRSSHCPDGLCGHSIGLHPRSDRASRVDLSEAAEYRFGMPRGDLRCCSRPTTRYKIWFCWQGWWLACLC